MTTRRHCPLVDGMVEQTGEACPECGHDTGHVAPAALAAMLRRERRERDDLRAALCALLQAARPATRRDAGPITRARLVEALTAAEAALDGTAPRG